MSQTRHAAMVSIPPGNRLREARESLDLSAEEVATQVEIPVGSVLAVEARGGFVAAGTMRTLSRLYLRTPGYLTGAEHAAPPEPVPAHPAIPRRARKSGPGQPSGT